MESGQEHSQSDSADRVGDGMHRSFLDGLPPSDMAADMTLRDWFAGQCLAQVAQTWAECEPKYATHVAAVAYMLADAMMAARKQGAIDA